MAQLQAKGRDPLADALPALLPPGGRRTPASPSSCSISASARALIFRPTMQREGHDLGSCESALRQAGQEQLVDDERRVRRRPGSSSSRSDEAPPRPGPRCQIAPHRQVRTGVADAHDATFRMSDRLSLSEARVWPGPRLDRAAKSLCRLSRTRVPRDPRAQPQSPSAHLAAGAPVPLAGPEPVQSAGSQPPLGAAPLGPGRCRGWQTCRATAASASGRRSCEFARRLPASAPCSQAHTAHASDVGEGADPVFGARPVDGPPGVCHPHHRPESRVPARSPNPAGCSSLTTLRASRSASMSVRRASTGSGVRAAQKRASVERAGKRSRAIWAMKAAAKGCRRS